jgi:hypothetical protein
VSVCATRYAGRLKRLERRMRIYTVHEPPPKRRGPPRGPEEFVLVRDGFYFWAFLLAPLWLLYRRLWLVLLGYILLMVAVGFGLRWIGVTL